MAQHQKPKLKYIIPATGHTYISRKFLDKTLAIKDERLTKNEFHLILFLNYDHKQGVAR